MTNRQSHDDGVVSDVEIAWLEARARGGFGVIETAAAHVALDGQGWQGELGVFDDRLIPGLSRLASAVHSHGSLAIAQIVHAGARAPAELVGTPWSATSFEDPTLAVRPREATEADIEDVIVAFATAARRAMDAGFDGVELHGAHGYLLGQFLSATQNTRADGWGGDLPGRQRLMREVVRAVRASIGEGVLCVRISPESGGQARGLDLDESLELAEHLVDDGMDVLHISLWDASRMTRKRPDEHPITAFRAHLGPTVPLVAAGNIWTANDARIALERGASAVALGRAAIGNADWAASARRPDWQPTRAPFSVEHLRSQAVSDGFAHYLKGFDGLVR